MTSSETSEAERPPDFSDLRAMFINCTLKPSPQKSHTQGLVDRSAGLMRARGVEVDLPERWKAGEQFGADNPEHRAPTS